jgi:hypothetical protein
MAWYWIVALTLAAQVVIVLLYLTLHLLVEGIRHGWWQPLHGRKVCGCDVPVRQWAPLMYCYHHGRWMVRRYFVKVPGMQQVLRRFLPDRAAARALTEEM